MTFDASGGQGGTTLTLDYGAELAAPTVTWTGHTFAGWSPDVPATVPAGDATYTAQWTANTYTVTLNGQGSANGASSVTATYGAAMPAISVPKLAGYAFGGYWTASNGGGTLYYTASGASARTWDKTAATTLYAKWTTPDKVQLWAGGPYWATTNIGAENPEDSGLYFWWGDTVGYRREASAWAASDDSSSNFSFGSGNTPTYNKGIDTIQGEGWVTTDGVLAQTHDAAHAHWGGNWQMPTTQDISLLINNCDWTWTTRNGVNGVIFQGRGDYVSASIFLPAAGFDGGTSIYEAGSGGHYWSSAGATSYEIYRAMEEDGTPTLVATVTTTSWTDTDVIYRNPYWYRVKAVSASQTSEFSAMARGYWGDWCLADAGYTDLMPLRSLLTGLEATRRDGVLSDEELNKAMQNATIADLDGDVTTISDAEISIFLRIQTLNQDKDLISSAIRGDYTYPAMTLADMVELQSISDAVRALTKY